MRRISTSIVQDMATGVRRRVFQGSGIVSVSGFRPDGAALALLHDRGYGDMSLLVLDLASGEARPIPAAARLQLPVRALGQRRVALCWR